MGIRNENGRNQVSNIDVSLKSQEKLQKEINDQNDKSNQQAY